MNKQFNYKRTESEEVHLLNEANEEEDGMEQKFEMSNMLVVTPGPARIAGAKQNEDIEMLLVMTADLYDHK